MISVIIPIYNCENYLSACLDSILNQTFTDFEIICVNDGSTDYSEDILKRYIKKDRRIKVLTIENHGQAYARNLGVSSALGEYICFVDADDTVDKEYFQKMMASMQQHDSDIAVCGMHRVFKKKPNWLERNFEYYPNISLGCVAKVSEKPELMLTIINAPYCKLIKKEFIDKHSIHFLEGRIYEDFYFTQSLLLYNPKISIVTDMLYHYFIHESSTMTSKKSRTEDMYAVMDSLLANYFEQELFNCYRDELEYLVIHHIAIGTVYRSTRQNWNSFFSERKRAIKFLEKYSFTVHNKYCKKMLWFVRLYLKIIF